jgi:hypothetical protein
VPQRRRFGDGVQQPKAPSSFRPSPPPCAPSPPFPGWAAAPPPRPLRGGFGPFVCAALLSHGAEEWSGRRDSNPRPSPWQGGVFRLCNRPHSPVAPFRPPSFHLVQPARRCSRAVYYRCSRATKPAATYEAWTASRWWSVSGGCGGLDRGPDARCVVVKGIAPRAAQNK